MLASDWTALLARELLTELHRRAEHQRLMGPRSAGGRTPGTRALRWHGREGQVPAGPAWRQRLPWRGSTSLGRGGEQA
jgi:hypothetical protein